MAGCKIRDRKVGKSRWTSQGISRGVRFFIGDSCKPKGQFPSVIYNKCAHYRNIELDSWFLNMYTEGETYVGH